MKIFKRVVVIIILVILIVFALEMAFFSGYMGVKVTILGKNIRPIKVKIIDSVTKEPIKNAIVYYKVGTAGATHFLGIPKIEPGVYRTPIKEIAYTNAEGVVYFPKRFVYLRLYEYISDEDIYINLDIKAESMKEGNKVNAFFKFIDEYYKNIDVCINPLGQYKGFLLVSYIDVLDAKVERYQKEKNKNILQIGEGLKKESEFITIELEEY